jgi:hypothetical protein
VEWAWERTKNLERHSIDKVKGRMGDGERTRGREKGEGMAWVAAFVLKSGAAGTRARRAWSRLQQVGRVEAARPKPRQKNFKKRG